MHISQWKCNKYEFDESDFINKFSYFKLQLYTVIVIKELEYIYTNGGVISVLLVNYQSLIVGEYLAYPVRQLNINQYQYYAVSTGAFNSSYYSEVLLVGTDDDTTVTVKYQPKIIITLPKKLISSSPLVQV
jgi:hypothetical protein